MAEKKRKTTAKKKTVKKPAQKKARKATKKAAQKKPKQSSKKPTKIKVAHSGKSESIEVVRPPEKIQIKITHFQDSLPEDTAAEEGLAATKIEVQSESEPPQHIVARVVATQSTPSKLEHAHKQSPREDIDTDFGLDDEEVEYETQADSKLPNQPRPKPHTKKAPLRWYLPALAIVGMLAILLAIPVTRYRMLNGAGFRTEATIEVIDKQTKLPLSNVVVQLDGNEQSTNEEGAAHFTGIRFGERPITITKKAYHEHSQAVAIGHGSNRFGAIELEASGKQFEFALIDWLSGELLTDGIVSSGEYSARLNSSGIARLNVPMDVADSITVDVRAKGYQQQSITLDTDITTRHTVSLVIAARHYFVSDVAGTYDVYQINPDGAQRQRIVIGTGQETNKTVFEVSPGGTHGILVASRDDSLKNPSGDVLSGVYVIDLLTSQLKKIDQSEQIDLVGWIGETIVYVKVQEGAKGNDPERHRLMAYDTVRPRSLELAASNFFHDVLVTDKHVFYASSTTGTTDSQAHLFRVLVDGTEEVKLADGSTWTILRTDIDRLAFNIEQAWYQSLATGAELTQVPAAPSSQISQLYAASPNGSYYARVDLGSSSEQLIIGRSSDGSEQMHQIAGIRYPLRWLDDTHLVYRVVSQAETADYIFDVRGGTAQKLSEVSNIAGIDAWYYYY